MGLDFLQKAAPSFRKGLDRRRIELATPNLFTHQPTRAPRTYAAILRQGHDVRVGEEVSVRLEDTQVLSVVRGFEVVATICEAPGELLDALADSHREGCGVVQIIHDIAGVAEIVIC